MGAGGESVVRGVVHAAGVLAAVIVLAVVSLAVSSSQEITVERLSTMAAIDFVRRQVHRANMGEALGYKEEIFRSVCDLTKRVPVLRLSRPRDLQRLGESVAAVERLAKEFV